MRLREVGIAPDVLVCRVKQELADEQREKIALFCDVAPDAVIAAADTDTIYSIPGDVRGGWVSPISWFERLGPAGDSRRYF